MSAPASRPTVPCSTLSDWELVSPDDGDVFVVANDNGGLRTSTRPTVPMGRSLVLLSDPFDDVTPLALPPT